MCNFINCCIGWRTNKWYSILFYSILFYSILFYSIYRSSTIRSSVLFVLGCRDIISGRVVIQSCIQWGIVFDLHELLASVALHIFMINNSYLCTYDLYGPVHYVWYITFYLSSLPCFGYFVKGDGTLMIGLCLIYSLVFIDSGANLDSEIVKVQRTKMQKTMRS